MIARIARITRASAVGRYDLYQPGAWEQKTYGQENKGKAESFQSVLQNTLAKTQALGNSNK